MLCLVPECLHSTHQKSAAVMLFMGVKLICVIQQFFQFESTFKVTVTHVSYSWVTYMLNMWYTESQATDVNL